MTAALARIVFIVGIAGLFWLDRDRKTKTSPALWVAVVWIAIGASRMVSQWFGGGVQIDSPDAYLEGSPVDRAILTGLLVAGLGVLIARAGRTGVILRANIPIVLFFVYCAISALWSDYPFVAFKRWTKALGNITMVLIILTDPAPMAALKRAFARVGFILIPVSVLLIKYYPGLGRGYSRWTWEPFFTGAATEKNALGAIALIFGLAALWRVIEVFRDRTADNRRGALAANGVVVAMTIWLFIMADSSTSLGCFLLGGMLMVLLSPSKGPGLVHATIGSLLAFAFSAYTFQDAYSSLVEAFGRDTTLTGRTEIWAELFTMDINPWLGTGFESFWLGGRAEHFWKKYYFHPNQAHNGYIETYINLGWIGLGLLVLIIAFGYSNIARMFKHRTGEGTVRLAFYTIALVYSITEAAFKVMHPVWIAFLLAVMAVPELYEAPAAATAPATTDSPPARLDAPGLRGWAAAQAAQQSAPPAVEPLSAPTATSIAAAPPQRTLKIRAF